MFLNPLHNKLQRLKNSPSDLDRRVGEELDLQLQLFLLAIKRGCTTEVYGAVLEAIAKMDESPPADY